MARWATLPALPAGAPSPAVRPTTIAAALPRFHGWFKYVRQASDNTCDAYQRTLAEFSRFADEVGLQELAAMTPEALEMYLAYGRQVRGNRPATSHRKLHAIRTFYNYLVREHLVASNPTLTVLVPKVGQRIPDYLSVPEQERLLDVLSRDDALKGRRLHMVVLLGLFTGLRVSELVAVRLDEIDLERAVLKVTKGKGNKQRESALTPRVMMALRAYLADVRPAFLPRDDAGRPVPVPWLFLSDPEWKLRGTKDRRVEPLTTKAISLWVGELSPIVGRRLHPHMLRHSFASRLREAGAPLELISEALGHSSIEVTMIYAHLSTSRQQRDITKYLEG